MNQAVASMSPKAANRYVTDAMRRFAREVAALPLSDHHDDVDLARIAAEMEAFQTGVTNWDDVATLPMQQQLQVAMSHLKDWVTELQPQVAVLEQQRHDLIEQD